MSTDLNTTVTADAQAMFAKRLLSRLENQELDHNISERLRVIRQAAIERAAQARLAPATQAQVASSTVSMGSVLARLNPFSGFDGQSAWSKSLFLLVPLAAALAYWLTMGFYSAQAPSTPALGVMSQTPSLSSTPFEAGSDKQGATATHLMQDPLPPSAYADAAFLEYMDRQIAAKND